MLFRESLIELAYSQSYLGLNFEAVYVAACSFAALDRRLGSSAAKLVSSYDYA